MHKPFLLAALEQAWLGRGSCAPNPAVGAVAVHNKKIIAYATHQGAGSAHAEQLLLDKLPANLSNITLYVTLEPCNHWGRTPPCTDAIIKYGITEVVYAYQDPNPLVSRNNTKRLLENVGIKVTYFPLVEITKFYQSYYYWTLYEKPIVCAKIAQTLDGKIAGKNGERILLSNKLCNKFTHEKRLHSDIILTSVKTINQDDPLLNVRMIDDENNNLNIAKNVAILDARNELNFDAKVLKKALNCHIFHDKNHKVNEPLENCIYHPVSSDVNLALNLQEILKILGKLGFHDVWVECGGALFGAFHKEKLVHHTYIYVVPAVLGHDALGAYCEDIFNGLESELINWQAMDDNMVLSISWRM